VSDRRYARKFGRQSGLSPKGRAAIIGAAAAALIAVPILVKTLTHRSKETVQTNPPATETVASTTTATTPATPSTTAPFTPTPTQASTGPAKIAVTEQAAEHEGSTLASVIAKRQPAAEDHSRDNWPPVICPEPDGSRLTYDKLKVEPVRSDTSGMHTPDHNRVIRTTPAATGNPSVCETTVTADGETTTKYDYHPEEPAAEAEQFFIPTAFTPNGDGLNDLFMVKANFEPRSFEMTVLNRGGDALFQTRDINIGWDGQLHGKLLPQGVYVCIIKYKDSQGNEHKQQGQVLLIP
jgi:gliding motility-associated-like protein